MYLQIVCILLILTIIYLIWYLDQRYVKINDKKVIQEAVMYQSRDLSVYPEVMEYLKNHRVYVSMTTSPIRIDKISKVLETLDTQNVEKIIVSIPYKFGRNGKTYKIPKSLSQNPKVLILRLEKDYGPISKILPALEYVYGIDPESAVISIDDDNAYPKSMVNEFIYNYVMKTDTAGNRPVVACTKRIFESNLPEIPPLLEGWSGVIYPAYLGSPENSGEIRALSSAGKSCYLSDDFVISYFLHLKGMPIEILMQNKYYNSAMIHQLSYGSDAYAIRKNDSEESKSDSGNYFNEIFDIHYGKYYNCYNEILSGMDYGK